MSAEVQRKPALQRRVDPVAAAVPDRVHAGETTSTAPAPAQPTHEPLNTSLQVRVRASCCLKQTSPVPRAVWVSAPDAVSDTCKGSDLQHSDSPPTT
jgi:hypothetical protein